MIKTILCVDPGTRRCGVAVFKDAEIVAAQVKTLFTNGFSRKRLKEVRKVFSSLIEDYAPNVLAIERPLVSCSKRSKQLDAIINEIKCLAKKEKIKIYEFSALAVRKIICGNAGAAKKDVAEQVSLIYPELKNLLKEDPKSNHPELKNCLNQDQKSDHLKLKIKLDEDKQKNKQKLIEKYWGHMFDAVGLGVCYLETKQKIKWSVNNSWKN
jgi:Holliday junction resolvasome RuvABC endonuclease subunit